MSGPHNPAFSATDATEAQREPSSPCCSRTSRTARSLTSIEYRFAVPIDSILSQVEVSGKADTVQDLYDKLSPHVRRSGHEGGRQLLDNQVQLRPFGRKTSEIRPRRYVNHLDLERVHLELQLEQQRLPSRASPFSDNRIGDSHRYYFLRPYRSSDSDHRPTVTAGGLATTQQLYNSLGYLLNSRCLS